MPTLSQEPEGQRGLSESDRVVPQKETTLRLQKSLRRRWGPGVGRAVRAAEGKERGIVGGGGCKCAGPETRVV